MFSLRRIARYGLLGGSVLGTGISLHSNNYDISGIGVVRFVRSGVALVEIASIYQRDLYFREWDKSSKEYREQRSKAHQKAANRLLELCCLNRGVYIKVGQHIGALEYLLPIEFVNTMKILHSKAPSNTLEEIYRVIRQELRCDVSFHCEFLFNFSVTCFGSGTNDFHHDRFQLNHHQFIVSSLTSF